MTPPRPPRVPWTGLLVAAVAIAVTTALVYVLRDFAPAVSLGVVYLFAVLIVALNWGALLGVLTSVLSAAAFNFFHLPPTGEFAVVGSENRVALAAFLTAAVATSMVAGLARDRAQEAQDRRREADLTAEMTGLLLGGLDLHDALATTAQRIAQAVGAPSAAIQLATDAVTPPSAAIQLATDAVMPPSAASASAARDAFAHVSPPAAALPPDERRVAIELTGRDGPLAALLVPAALSPGQQSRLRERVAPALASVLQAALDREALQADVVETASLRRSDELKTALLRSVSHDLRTPITAIITAATAMKSPSLEPGEREDMSAVVLASGQRLARLIEQLLDLSLLEAGTAAPRRIWCSIEEILTTALEHLPAGAAEFQLALDPELPLVRADPAQLERAFVNLLENASRYASGQPVSVRARVVSGRLRVRIVDRGPGIPSDEQERIFLPFYRAGGRDSGPDPGHVGSGLGLAIAKGFLEAGGGHIAVESLPGQGTSFVIELPLEPVPAARTGSGR